MKGESVALLTAAFAVVSGWRGTRYEALHGGRPSSAMPVPLSKLAALARSAALDGQTSRVWLDLTNSESLVVAFEPVGASDSAEGCCCTMRVKQQRIVDECPVDGGCDDSGCVAVRWDLHAHEAVLLDLFKAKGGERLGCDLSSADDSSVRWGELMMCVAAARTCRLAIAAQLLACLCACLACAPAHGATASRHGCDAAYRTRPPAHGVGPCARRHVLDHMASLLGMRYVFVADEAVVELGIRDADASGGSGHAPVPLSYLHALIHGMGYYERHGFYRVPHDQFYFSARHSTLDYNPELIATARESAARELGAIDAARRARFGGHGLCRVLEAIEHGSEALRGVWPPPPSVKSTLIYRFANAMARAHDMADGEACVEAFAAAVREDDAGTGGPLPNRFRVHARSTVPYEPSLGSFVRRHAEALDAAALSAPSLGELARVLRDRCRSGESEVAANAAEVAAGNRAHMGSAALLAALTFDFYAAWQPRRERPLMRKDFRCEAGGEVECSAVIWSGARLDGQRSAAIGWRPPVPILHEAFLITINEDDA
jgi:hypothetical protein